MTGVQTCALPISFDDGNHGYDWCYASDDGTAPVQFGTGINSGEYGGWVQAGADTDTLWVKISKEALGCSFHWHGYANYYNAQDWINPVNAGTGIGSAWDASMFEVSLMATLPTPFTLQSGEQLPFCICYTFDLHASGSYTLKTYVDAI